ncbi:MAG: hypothetical protein ABI787_00550 [Spartobacteria bacterium]
MSVILPSPLRYDSAFLLDFPAFPARFRPGQREEMDVAALFSVDDSGQGRPDDLFLQLLMKWNPEMMSHHEGQKHRSGRLEMLGDIQRNRQ